MDDKRGPVAINGQTSAVDRQIGPFTDNGHDQCALQPIYFGTRRRTKRRLLFSKKTARRLNMQMSAIVDNKVNI